MTRKAKESFHTQRQDLIILLMDQVKDHHFSDDKGGYIRLHTFSKSLPSGFPMQTPQTCNLFDFLIYFF